MPVLQARGLGEDDVFNPEVEQWTPDRAAVEGIHFARDVVLLVAVTNQREGHSSIAEAGFAAHGGMLRGQKVIIAIEDNADSPEPTRVARRLAKTVLTATNAQFPTLFTMTDSIRLMAEEAALRLKDRKSERLGGVSVRTEYTLPSLRTDLDPGIYLSGTSGREKPTWMRQVGATIEGYGVSVSDSYHPNWEVEGDIADEELRHKLTDAVQLIAITDQTENIGALGELGARIMYADLTGQSIGVYIEPHGSAPDSATNRTRTIALEYLRRLREDFPGHAVFVAQNLQELALFGLSEHFKQKLRLHI